MARIIICPDCGAKKRYHALGLCKTCYNRQYMREYMPQYRQEHAGRIRSYKRSYYAANRENEIACQRRYYMKNREKILAYNRAYSREHREEMRLRLRDWRKNNPEREAAIACRQRARRRAVPATLTAEQSERLFAIGRAMYPGEELHLDHFMPLSAGGGTTLANMRAIPAALNLSKHDKLPQEIFEQISFLGEGKHE